MSEVSLIPEEKHIPWIVFESYDWIQSILKPDMNIFEWGSGGSTLFFAKNVNKIISVEHVKEWHGHVKKALDDLNIQNCDYFLIEPEGTLNENDLNYDINGFSSLYKSFRGMSFEKYVKKILEFPDNYFDIVFVDGRSRISCINLALKKIKQNGYLILDNSERKSYDVAKELLKKHDRIDFFGNGPYNEGKWQTTIWKIK